MATNNSALPDVDSLLELVPRQCHLRHYEKIKVPSFELADDFIASASPESTYAVTKKLMEAASESILIGIYDFTAKHMQETLVAAMQRGVKVSLMLDLDQRKGEPELWNELLQEGIEGVPAPPAPANTPATCHRVMRR